MQGSFQIGTNEIAARPVDPALYLVATPIGNLSDITLRALQVLASADVLACEDTRVTRTLLGRYGIKTRPFAYHEHNAERAAPKLIAALAEGKSVALVSDAGTPLISDPGYRLVEQALAEDITVVPIPGASAPLAALVASGLPSDSFLFAGFLPVKDKARRDRLLSLKDTPATLLFFESPRRIAGALAAAADALGPDRPAAVCRELTKAFEEVRRASLGELAAHYADVDKVKGEIVLVVGPPGERKASAEDADAVLRELAQTLSPAKAATEAARRTGLPRKLLYQRLMSMKDAAS
ncbi:MAG: 16S rRNA (cytidine(1402)-2'-O)-methyltransferase [Hyphomicrobiales bacterium]|nr:16S rRNA (cytidine(1402)-2'-O)-methyltransferase [Hyphomicrobiales bacterium]MCP5000248.1 16S rRNA (cytidine(1402)-2'-O)-methyltransferase [Hyphomicrobiales bacterium]